MVVVMVIMVVAVTRSWQKRRNDKNAGGIDGNDSNGREYNFSGTRMNTFSHIKIMA